MRPVAKQRMSRRKDRDRARAMLRAVGIVCAFALGCTVQRAAPPPNPVYDRDLDTLLLERCGSCHAGADAAAGYGVDSYLQTLACPQASPSTPATARSDGGVALLDVLVREDHADLLSVSEQARLEDWVRAKAPLRENAVHAAGILNPRSDDWHGKLAAKDRFGPLVDPNHPEACARCHAGSPGTVHVATLPAAGAPACTTCHTAPEGVLACGTCHGDGAARAYPPRDRCKFGGSAHDAHRAHVSQGALRQTPLACRACHSRADATLLGRHGNGTVDVQFDSALAGADARFDAVTGTCAVSCHARGGARSELRFDETGPLGCGDCHGAPPQGHFAGACDECHSEANADATALRAARLHMNGRIDLGDGSGGCAVCHGEGNDPMPPMALHRLHRDTRLTAEITCTECHSMPETVTSEGHLDRGAKTPPDVVFGPRASARGQTPSYAQGTCREIACHGAGLMDGIERALRWDERATQSCSGCHKNPPLGTHPQDEGCASTLCHGDEIRVGKPLSITDSGRALHIDGHIDVGGR